MTSQISAEPEMTVGQFYVDRDAVNEGRQVQVDSIPSALPLTCGVTNSLVATGGPKYFSARLLAYTAIFGQTPVMLHFFKPVGLLKVGSSGLRPQVPL